MTVKIMIDPGHGGSDPGATGNGLKEKDLNLSIAKKTKAYLDKYFSGHKTRLTRDSDITLPLNARPKMANDWGADYFLSIHVNAGGGSGYEDFIYSGRVQAQTSRIREVIHGYVSNAVDWGNRGKKRANFHVLRETKMPAMLTENGFIDNKRDAKLLKQDKVINDIAKAHAVGLANAFKLGKKKKTEERLNGTMYKVQVGAFLKKENAEKFAKKLKADGYDVYIVKE